MTERWWYLSFASESAFLGAAIVRGASFIDAISQTTLGGYNPGGEVMGGEVTGLPMPPLADRERLLSKAELDVIFDDVVRAKDEDFPYGLEDQGKPS